MTTCIDCGIRPVATEGTVCAKCDKAFAKHLRILDELNDQIHGSI